MNVESRQILGMQSKEIMSKYVATDIGTYYPNWNKKELRNSILITTSPYELESIQSSLIAKKSIGLQDGVFDFSNSFNNPFFFNKSYKLHFPAINDVILCFGKKEASYIAGFNKRTVVKTYIPEFVKRTMKLADDFNNPEPEYDVMLTTANTAYFDESEFKLLVNYLESVIDSLLSSGYKICIRIFDNQLLNALSLEDIDNLKEGSFVEAAANVKSVITTPSTLAVESMILGLPTATLIYRDMPITTQTGWMLYNPAIVCSVVESMLNNNRERLSIQRVLLENYLEPEVKDATVKTLTRLSQLSDQSKTGREGFAESILLSTWNFNLKFLIKRLLCKLKS
ncbi:hypothetical protein [Vibrio mediterranei]|uniref:Uncharacterized protein n=1 Tax=Vibrio mediterranei TaxID=689 RepID=A0AAN1FEN1_9VIBR|nr:hypothetical protein [Vibrio mediterranei]ASI89244.1 hypothetical protein BSZ05_05160 [Vibrio mediterranei]